jgi:hypothetical protein
VLHALPVTASAQHPGPRSPRLLEPSSDGWSVAAGAQDDERLRIRQLLGWAPLIPVSLRPFSPAEARALVGADTQAAALDRPRSLYRARPWVTLQANSGRAYMDNDGPVWAGRGLTVAGSWGVLARYGVLRVALRPVAFVTQNLRPLHTEQGGLGAAPGIAYAGAIDLPERFGSKPYGRIDLGESSVRLDGWGASFGVSTAGQVWGPAHFYPLLIGTNAGGFPHVFLGTERPLDVWIGRVSVRSVTGRLTSSGYAPAQPGSRFRLGAGLVAVFVPRGLPALELGGGRFFHQRWTADALSPRSITTPLQGLLKGDRSDSVGVDENQLASAFFRLAPRGAGVEIYGEYLRDDHSSDFRDLALEPDHDSAYLLGLQRAVASRDSAVVSVLTIEVVNSRFTHLHRVRGHTPPYTHVSLVEGHTHRGQILGSPMVLGGGGHLARFDRYHSAARWTMEWRREHLGQDREGGSWNGAWPMYHTLALSHARLRGTTEWGAGVTLQLGYDTQDRPTHNLRVVMSARRRAASGTRR